MALLFSRQKLTSSLKLALAAKHQEGGDESPAMPASLK
jgi:hypothetical protein